MARKLWSPTAQQRGHVLLPRRLGHPIPYLYGDKNAVKCEATKADGDPCNAYAVKGGSKCFLHSGNAKALSEQGAAKSAEVRRDRLTKREQRLEDAKLTLTQKIRLFAAENADAITAALGKAAIADGSSPAMRELLQRVEGKVADRVETVDGNDPSRMDEAQLTAWLGLSLDQLPATEEQH
jgi:hypothetical protein